MFRHVVMLRFAAGTPASHHQKVVDGLRALPPVIPEIRSYSVGADAGLAEGNWDLVVVADFDDAAGWRHYTAHAAHQAVIADLIRPVLAERAAVQFDLDRSD